jgi:hypothetical protein
VPANPCSAGQVLGHPANFLTTFLANPTMQRLHKQCLPLLQTLQMLANHVQAPAARAARVFEGLAFFRSGLTKLDAWWWPRFVSGATNNKADL